jgi:hypothetical protein
MMARSTTRSNQRPDTLMQDRRADRSIKTSCDARPDHTLGQIRPFALVELHVSFTLASKHSPRQSSRHTLGPMHITSLSVFFWVKIADERVAFAHAGPRDVADGRWSQRRDGELKRERPSATQSASAHRWASQGDCEAIYKQNAERKLASFRNRTTGRDRLLVGTGWVQICHGTKASAATPSISFGFYWCFWRGATEYSCRGFLLSRSACRGDRHEALVGGLKLC